MKILIKQEERVKNVLEYWWEEHRKALNYSRIVKKDFTKTIDEHNLEGIRTHTMWLFEWTIETESARHRLWCENEHGMFLRISQQASVSTESWEDKVRSTEWWPDKLYGAGSVYTEELCRSRSRLLTKKHKSLVILCSVLASSYFCIFILA